MAAKVLRFAIRFDADPSRYDPRHASWYARGATVGRRRDRQTFESRDAAWAILDGATPPELRRRATIEQFWT